MKYIIGLLSCLLFFSIPVDAQELSAEDILKTVDQALDLRDSELEMEMQVYRNKKLRKTYKMNVKYEKWEYMLSETLYPPRNKGEKMLKQGENAWLYLPKINKTMRVSESNSFSNSDFSNMDIMNPQLSEDYVPTLLGIEDNNGEGVYKLELTAKTEEMPYAKILYWIRKSDLYPLRRDYYTFSGHLLKRLLMQTKTDARGSLPDVFIMSSVLEKDKYSVMRYLNVEIDRKFPPEIFRKDTLAKR